MSNVSLVTFSYVLRALEKHTSINKHNMLNHIGINEQALGKMTHVKSEALSSVFQYCIHQSQDHALALKMGQSISYHSLGLLGYLMVHTSTLKQMIEKFYYYQRTVGSFIKFHLSKTSYEYKISVYMNENPYIEVPRYHAEVHLSGIVSILSQILNVSLVPDRTYFSFCKVDDSRLYERVFGKNICFESNENAIVFNSKSLKLKVKHSNEEMLSYFEKESEKVLHDLEDTSYYAKVKKEILKSIGESEITLDFVAAKLGISSRVLQYWLKEEKKTFREALLQVRMQLAEHYIHNSTLDLHSIAFFLGYNEASSFFRAYKKYFNKTPRE